MSSKSQGAQLPWRRLLLYSMSHAVILQACVAGGGLNRQSRRLLKRPPAVKISRLQTVSLHVHVR